MDNFWTRLQGLGIVLLVILADTTFLVAADHYSKNQPALKDLALVSGFCVGLLTCFALFYAIDLLRNPSKYK